MKKLSIILLLLSISFVTFSQTIGDYIDVLYLKNGSKIKGVIIEQIPGKSITIKTNDGSEFVYHVSEVAKFTREEIIKPDYQNGKSSYSSKYHKTSVPDSLRFMNNYKKRKKGHFANFDLLLNTSGKGFRITNGYRFGRFGNIGIALGFEGIQAIGDEDTFNPANFGPGGGSLVMYHPPVSVASVNLVYSGELFNKRITPFYQVEAGYGFAIDRYGYFMDTDAEYGYEADELYARGHKLNYGGPMAGLALGFKFHTKRRLFFKLALDARVTSNFYDNHYFNYGENGEIIQNLEKGFTANPGLGIRFGIGF